MRRLEDHEIVFIALAAVTVIYITYEGAKKLRGNADLYAPQRQPPPDTFDFQANLGFMVAPDGHTNMVPAEQHHAGYVYTPHRYPRTIGGNVTSAIHHGFSTMRIPNVQDVQWIISPPSEVAW